MRVVLLGAPGSGKGTQAKILAKQYGMVQISIGAILRAAVEEGSALGKQAKPYMDGGQLVPDDVVLGLLSEHLQAEDTENGFILNGFPRNVFQAEELDVILNELRQPLHGALLIDVGVDALIQRLTGRQTCGSCGQMYNLYTDPSKLFDRCDQCGGDLRQRTDDNEETIGNRLRIFEAATKPLFNYYKGLNKLRAIQGVGEINDIAAAVSKELKTLPSEESLQAELEKLSKGDVTLEDLERKVLESLQNALGIVDEEVVKPADKALKKAEKTVKKGAKALKKKVTKAVKKEAKILKKEAKAIKKKVTKAVKKETKVLKKEAKAIKKKVTKAVKEIKKKVTKATAKKKPAVKKVATKKKPVVKKAAVKKKTATKKKAAKKK